MARAKRRADGRYCSQIYLGRDADGKKKYKSVLWQVSGRVEGERNCCEAWTYFPSGTTLPSGRIIG